MRKLPLPTFDDASAIEALASKRGLMSYPHIKPHVEAIKAGYTQYHAASGDADAVMNVPIPEPQATFLRKHYKSPPKAIDEIKSMLSRHLARPCSMCGSSHAYELDHVFPKDDYPAFAVYTRNLVPACDCNRKKGATLRGNAAGARILHPYYDNCLSERLYSAKINDPGPTIKADIEIVIDHTHPNYAAVEFHLISVIKKTGVLNWMTDQWVLLLRHPQAIIGTFNFIPQTEQSIIDALSTQLGLCDLAKGSPNNWESMFVMGLLDPIVTAWLFEKMSADGRFDPNSPLVAQAVA
ncbi:hypothetical protein [Rhizobium leguminosarum]|uniref:hypothetical protein n=1 Tax=Rhizobium leguminosarum TaxID=384 RepID=UPI0010393D4F|nr:hypothetical protein [Rhizobium leguminosarum]TBY82344.1 hypothetical protein E0H32_13690 [Rhizobium leguminosarum bv. viciae]